MVERIKVAGILVPSWNTDGKPPAGIQKLLLEHLQKTILDRIAGAGRCNSFHFLAAADVRSSCSRLREGRPRRSSFKPSGHSCEAVVDPTRRCWSSWSNLPVSPKPAAIVENATAGSSCEDRRRCGGLWYNLDTGKVARNSRVFLKKSRQASFQSLHSECHDPVTLTGLVLRATSDSRRFRNLGESIRSCATGWDDVQPGHLELYYHSSRGTFVPRLPRPIFHSFFILIKSLLLLAGRSVAQAPPEYATQLTVTRIVSGEFQNESSGPYHWLKDGSAYLVLAESKEGKGRDIVRHDPLSSKSEVLVPAGKLCRRVRKSRWPSPISPSAKRVENCCCLPIRARSGGSIHGEITGFSTAIPGRCASLVARLRGFAQFAAFNPQGSRVAYVRENNLYVEEIAAGTVVP